MRQVCTYCQQMVEDGNIWCQEKNCPAERAPQIFSYGEFLGDLEIVTHLATLPTAAIYEARRDDTPFLLKVAHEGFAARLEREAECLAKFHTIPNSIFPRLCPAHAQQSLHLGHTDFRGQIKYYTLYEYIDGEILSSLLLKNPQLYYEHAGWLVLALAEAIEKLHDEGIYHLALSPDAIMVRYDRQGIPRPVLIDLGMVARKGTDDILPIYAGPRYIAPEIANGRKSNEQTDVYGLGLILYELLAGRPLRAAQWRPPQWEHVASGASSHFDRKDLTGALNELVRQATNPSLRERPPDVTSFREALAEILQRPIPAEAPPSRFPWQAVGVAAGALILILFLLVLAVHLNEAGLGA